MRKREESYGKISAPWQKDPYHLERWKPEFWLTHKHIYYITPFELRLRK